MAKINNTANDPKTEWLFGGNPNAIEQQEAQGQKDLSDSTQLPRIVNYPRGANPVELYSKMGITVLTTSKGDDLFMGVKLPAGWKVQPTDHSMWSDLIDNEGKKRASIFYKAAFYDRDAFINFED